MTANPTDPFYNYPYYMGTPARAGVTLTESDTDNLAVYTKSLFIGTAGDLKVTLTGMDDGEFVTFVGHPAGYAPLQVKRLWTATTALNIVGLYDPTDFTP